jgi:hypothetical protein
MVFCSWYFLIDWLVGASYFWNSLFLVFMATWSKIETLRDMAFSKGIKSVVI